MEHEMTLFHTMEPIEMFCSRHTFFLWPHMVPCGHLLTQDDAEQLEFVIGHATLLYLVMIGARKMPTYVEIFKISVGKQYQKKCVFSLFEKLQQCSVSNWVALLTTNKLAHSTSKCSQSFSCLRMKTYARTFLFKRLLFFSFFQLWDWLFHKWIFNLIITFDISSLCLTSI